MIKQTNNYDLDSNPNLAIIPNIAIIIIAAGSSSRLGQPKQLVKINQVSLIYRITEIATKLSSRVNCVLGYQAETMQAALKDLNVHCLLNSNWQQGMGSSIALAVKQLDKSVSGAMILLCDQWALSKMDLQKLINCWLLQPSKIVASQFTEHKVNQDKINQDVIGSPAIFPLSYFTQLSNLTDKGAKKLIENNPDVIPCRLENARFDLDTKEDLEIITRSNS